MTKARRGHKRPDTTKEEAKTVKEPEAKMNGTKMAYDKIHLLSLQIMTTNKEAMKAMKKEAKTAKYLRLEDDKESQEGNGPEAGK